jgi:hypothetical protein
MRVMAGTTFPQSSDSPPFAKGGQGGFGNVSLAKPAINPPHSPFTKGEARFSPFSAILTTPISPP